MPVSKERVEEVVGFYSKNGAKKAMEVYQIPSDTLNRYIRKYKQDGNVLDDTVGRMCDKFTPEQLSHLLEMDMGHKPYPVVKGSFDGETVKYLALGDDHIGSIHFDPRNLLSAFEEAEKQGCQFLINTGDIIEGHSGRPGHVYECNFIGYGAQKKEAIRLYSEWKKPAYIIAGNHANWINTKQDAGLDVVEDICAALPNASYLGTHEGYIDINGARIGILHGEDASGSYAYSYRLQKIAEMYTGGTKPSCCFTGHSHKSMYCFTRNIHMVSTGAMQYQSSFMRNKRIPCHTGFWIIEMTTRNSEVIRFSPTWYPIYE